MPFAQARGNAQGGGRRKSFRAPFRFAHAPAKPAFIDKRLQSLAILFFRAGNAQSVLRSSPAQGQSGRTRRRRGAAFRPLRQQMPRAAPAPNFSASLGRRAEPRKTARAGMRNSQIRKRISMPGRAHLTAASVRIDIQ